MTDIPQGDAPAHDEPDEMPNDEELQEPSTEKDPDEVPKAPAEDDEPSHEAVGIGVIGRPQTAMEEEDPET